MKTKFILPIILIIFTSCNCFVPLEDKDMSPYFDTEFITFIRNHSIKHGNPDMFYELDVQVLFEEFVKSEKFLNTKPKDRLYKSYHEYMNNLTFKDSLMIYGCKMKINGLIDLSTKYDLPVSALKDYLLLPPFKYGFPRDRIIFNDTKIGDTVTFTPMKAYLVPSDCLTTQQTYDVYFRWYLTFNNADTLFLEVCAFGGSKNEMISYPRVKYTPGTGNGDMYYSNLVFEEFSVESGSDQVLLLLNPINQVTFVANPPLTGTKVKEIVENGVEGVDWELMLVTQNSKNYTTYKIGENLYLPTIGNTYRYFGSTSLNGATEFLSRIQPVLGLEILH